MTALPGDIGDLDTSPRWSADRVALELGLALVTVVGMGTALLAATTVYDNRAGALVPDGLSVAVALALVVVPLAAGIGVWLRTRSRGSLALVSVALVPLAILGVVFSEVSDGSTSARQARVDRCTAYNMSFSGGNMVTRSDLPGVTVVRRACSAEYDRDGLPRNGKVRVLDTIR